jgi:hypothetical protein
MLFGTAVMNNNIFKIEVYVPVTHCEMLKSAMFNAGAGKLGNYDRCAWQSFTGTGQFRPLKGSSPFLGQTGKVEQVKEIKIELICEEKYLHKVIEAIKKYHPYETPAFQYWRVGSE